MSASGVKSRPQYAPLQFDPSGRFHLLIGQGEGGQALLQLCRDFSVGAEFRVIYTGESVTGCDLSEHFRGDNFANVTISATQSAALQELDQVLSACVMGTRLYVAGSEDFIGLVEQIAVRYNIQRDELQREHQGSRARRVFCVHCQSSNEDVTTNIIRCRGCGRWLVVRDHYSRRLAAFMGVMADAEVPGSLPEIREVFA